eukprot:4407719-Pyramimonas_sp.AAC.1
MEEPLQPPGLARDAHHLVVPIWRIEVVHVRKDQPRTPRRPRRGEGDGFDVIPARVSEPQNAAHLPSLLPKLLAP